MVTAENVPQVGSTRSPGRLDRDGPWERPGDRHDRPAKDVDSLEGLVDRLVDSHEAVVAGLADDVREVSRSLREDLGDRPARPAGPSREESLEHHLASFRNQRRERAQESSRLRPVDRPVRLDAPLVTRAGVIYVPPEFDSADGLDPESAQRLLRAGFRTVDVFLSTSEEELAQVSRRPVSEVQRAKRDLDLERLPHVDKKAADLLRLAGCGTVSRLSVMDPTLLVHDLSRIQGRYRFVDLPDVLDGERAVGRLVAAAQARSE